MAKKMLAIIYNKGIAGNFLLYRKVRPIEETLCGICTDAIGGKINVSNEVSKKAIRPIHKGCLSLCR